MQRFLPELRAASSIPILGIAEEVAKLMSFKTVGLLATEATMNACLFDNALKEKNVSLVKPTKEQQPMITKIILNILNGKKTEGDKTTLLLIIDSLKLDGAEAVILGCTDLPLLISQEDVSIPIIDTIRVNAEAAVNYCLNTTEEKP